MRNSKDIPLPKLFRILEMPQNQTRHQILPPIARLENRRLLVERPPARHLLERHARDQRVLGAQPGDKLPQWVPPQQVIELGHLTYDAVVRLRIVDGLDGLVHIPPLLKEPEAAAEGHFAEHVKGKVVQPVAQVKDARVVGDVGIDLASQQLDGVVDKGAELLHGGHAVGYVGDTLLLGVHLFARLGEDVWVLGWREDAVEGSLKEAFARA